MKQMTIFEKRNTAMRHRALIVFGAVVLSVMTYPSNSIASDKINNKDAIPWSKKMQALYKTLADLLTDITSDQRFNNPLNKSRIQNEADQLSGLAHDLTKKRMISVDSDPTIQIVAGLLRRETKRAAVELKRGSREYARGILRSVPNYCIACHTRNASGPQFAELSLEPSEKSLTSLDRGEFFAASRQFDRAQNEFRKVINDAKGAEANIWNWERAVQHSLAIAVRVKKDPVQAGEIVQTIQGTPSAPSFMREDAKTWKTSITDWKEELPRQPLTEEGLYAEATRLMAKAREIQKYPMDRTADILYLRASAVVHDLLQKAPEGVHSADALLLAGLSYEVLSPLKTEDLHEIYYEACIRKAPHSPTADLCYRRYEMDIFLEYTGSGGTDVPEDVRTRLLELLSLSQPLPAIRK